MEQKNYIFKRYYISLAAFYLLCLVSLMLAAWWRFFTLLGRRAKVHEVKAKPVEKALAALSLTAFLTGLFFLLTNNVCSEPGCDIVPVLPGWQVALLLAAGWLGLGAAVLIAAAGIEKLRLNRYLAVAFGVLYMQYRLNWQAYKERRSLKDSLTALEEQQLERLYDMVHDYLQKSGLAVNELPLSVWPIYIQHLDEEPVVIELLTEVAGYLFMSRRLPYLYSEAVTLRYLRYLKRILPRLAGSHA